MYKAIKLALAALALTAPAAAITPRGAAAATAPNAQTALKLRGGTFGFDAHQTGEQCGIEEPEKEVVKTIKTAVTYPIKKVFGIARGGALLDVSARETAEACEIEDPEPLVVRTIKAAFDYILLRGTCCAGAVQLPPPEEGRSTVHSTGAEPPPLR